MKIFSRNGTYRRMTQVTLGLMILGLGFYLVLSALEDNLVFYYTPSQMIAKNPESTQKLRLGGVVKTKSIQPLKNNEIKFVVTDMISELPVTYQGPLPDLFREGQGVVAEGYYGSGQVFQAQLILAKHDETYRPPEHPEEAGAYGNKSLQMDDKK